MAGGGRRIDGCTDKIMHQRGCVVSWMTIHQTPPPACPADLSAFRKGAVGTRKLRHSARSRSNQEHTSTPRSIVCADEVPRCLADLALQSQACARGGDDRRSQQRGSGGSSGEGRRRTQRRRTNHQPTSKTGQQHAGDGGLGTATGPALCEQLHRSLTQSALPTRAHAILRNDLDEAEEEISRREWAQ
jgi:hypothetical protein